ETLVRLLGRAEAGEHAHGPRAAPVHRRLDAPREGVLARKAEVPKVIDADTRGRHEIGDLDAAPCGKLIEPGRELARRVGDGTRSPRSKLALQALELLAV